MYYQAKIESLRDLFGADSVAVVEDGDGEALVVDGRRYPIVDDVIVLLHPDHYPPALRRRLSGGGTAAVGAGEGPFADDIQHTFGAEWQAFPEILPEHEVEFRRYFDVVDPELLRGKRVCDLGCGIGRWAHFVAPMAREMVLVDFSEAVFVARENMRDHPSALFFMGDLTRLPFRDDFADFLYCLGVLHHLPVDAIEMSRRLAPLAPRQLIYLYSALDARPFHHRLLMKLVTVVRLGVCRVRSERFRTAFSWFGTYGVYLPLVYLGKALRPLGAADSVPLYGFYHDKSPGRICQDVYDRFFTRIEQRVSRKQIGTLSDVYDIVISDGLPQWHFLCKRRDRAAAAGEG